MLADIMPTAYEVGVLNGRVSPPTPSPWSGPVRSDWPPSRPPGCSHARVIAVDVAESRLEAARLFGADTTILASADPDGMVTEMTDGLGADVVIEAVGVPDTFELCTRLVRAGGHLANVGVHGKPVTLHLEDLWIKNLTITTGLVDTYSTPTLMSMLATGQLDTAPFVTHHFPMEAMIEAYDAFSRASDTGALKVVLTRS